MENNPKLLLTDFPKIECPFIRKTFKVDKESFKKNGKKVNLRSPEVYLAISEINPGYEWVFDDPETFAVEKVDGSNVKILTAEAEIITVQNRMNFIDILKITPGVNLYILDGIVQAAIKGYILKNGEQAGELLGPKFQGNPYKLKHHLWFPFDRSHTQLRYKSFDNYERTYENWSDWFKENLFSLFFQKISNKNGDPAEKMMAEGVVFYNLKRKEEGKPYMAKLRRDMFDWFYTDYVEILS
ncbi:MAG: hypothetical protein PF518_08350 [Spirochaetaceae bacterium]|jgi:hypothetical protein|nr:hypothetical protein [Spirochaetaceae bacterium]